ncbi:MAG: Maf family protein [Frankiaceae bacterium]
MPSRPLVLASASPARLRLLRDSGLAPVVMVSGVDESAVPRADPYGTVATLAALKATAVAEQVAGRADLPGALVLGCDSLLQLDGELLGKPDSPEVALQRWRRMRGRAGDLLTGHCLVDASTGRRADAVAATTVRFGWPDDDELAAYVASGEPLRVAGAFTLDGRSAPFVDGIDGDHGNVIGLSLPLLRRLLSELGVRITDLWA